MADVTLSYKGSDILELSDSGSATLKTGGKYCEDNIAVEYVKPSGGGSPWELIADYTSDAIATVVTAEIPSAYQSANVYKVQINVEFTRTEYPYFGINGGNPSYEQSLGGHVEHSFVGYIVKAGRTGQRYALAIGNSIYAAANNPTLAQSVYVKSYYENAIEAGCNIKVWRLVE